MSNDEKNPSPEEKIAPTWKREGAPGRYRRFLLDMHIPDWDDRFLSKYNPKEVADLLCVANVNSVMLYTQTHVGLSYWPTPVGRTHKAAKNRDLLGEMLSLCKERALEVFAYYSLSYNNLAYLKHPEWRLKPIGKTMKAAFIGDRYGIVCPNNLDYRRFAAEESEGIVRKYAFDGFFFDMTFWPTICTCPSCRKRYRQENGRDIPTTVDWFSEAWCTFQAARESWMIEFAKDMTATVKEIHPGIPVFHNFAVSLSNWRKGTNFALAKCNDFLGGDFYGDQLEQHLISRFMLNLSESKPVEFMTSRCVHLTDHVQTKSFDLLEIQSFAALHFNAAFRFIDGIDPIGTVNHAVYEMIGKIYRQIERYEAHLGGIPFEEIAVYLSDNSKMNFTENGVALVDPALDQSEMPHLEAVKGALRTLQQAHLPFGVITRKQLGNLGQYRLIILPNILRMEKEEADAFRTYVAEGGALYASRYTSLTDTVGIRYDEFMLSDVFGCGFEADLEGKLGYVRPVEETLSAAIEPQDYISHYQREDGTSGLVCLQAGAEGDVLAALTLPYGAPREGSVYDHNWASIHSSPPWDDTEIPLILERNYGKGRCIYSAADIETRDSPAHTALFLALLRRLLGGPCAFEFEANPAIWTNVTHQPERNRYLISLLNYQKQQPVVPAEEIVISLNLPDGRRPVRLLELPEERENTSLRLFENNARAYIEKLNVFMLLALEYETNMKG